MRAPLKRLLIKSGRRLALLAVDDIDWIEAADYYVSVHARGRSHLIRETMHSLERRLDPRRFFRVHRSALVNLDRVSEVRQSKHGEHTVVLHTGDQVPLARARRTSLERALQERG